MTTDDVLLRPALELAFAVAYYGQRAKPPVPVPTSLQQYLKFQKLPAPALVPFRKALEKDEEFRARVAAAATEEVTGRAGYLWLARPAGWEEELAGLVAAQQAELEATEAAQAEKGAAKKLAATEDALRRAELELTARRGAQERAEADREAAVADAVKARQRADELERALANARAKAERATERAAATEAEATTLRNELATLRARVAELEAAVAGAPPVPDAPPALPPTAPDAPPVPDAAVRALAEAAAATEALARALGRTAAALGGPGGPAPASDAGAGAGSAEGGARRNGHGGGARRRRVAATRRPLRLPRGLTADSDEGIDWLVAGAGARVLVDGYNVAKLGWPDEPLPVQRERLLDALDDLVCRRGTAIDVVFDGADVGPVMPGKRRLVRVRFSSPGELADDVLRAAVREMPPEQNVVVVTNDREVVDAVKSSGANVVRSEQLLALARR